MYIPCWCLHSCSALCHCHDAMLKIASNVWNGSKAKLYYEHYYNEWYIYKERNKERKCENKTKKIIKVHFLYFKKIYKNMDINPFFYNYLQYKGTNWFIILLSVY